MSESVVTLQGSEPPNSLEAEQAVLGSVLISAAALVVVADSLTADSFYHPRNRLIFSAITALASREDTNNQIDVVLVANY